MAANTSPTRPEPAAAVVADLAAGHKPLSLRRAACQRCLRRDGKALSPSTIYRWVNNGIRGVHLGVGYIGDRQVTTRPALLRFIDEVTSAAALPRPASPARLHDQAVRELDRAGI